ncbi:NAD(P)/FAD-dependent oxidoreductase [Nitrosomonas sp. PY1]|uniref:NAD(P)/FAD-dependent oxidoreductase n=1 Tax=Nitrosomonas sp. PY1 TaxID=1803906 RepID=UPI001FC7DE1A|nr:NAD(P)/FAD-dependent oxidoreductase [Nitrosomonas sp. PY1]
MMCAIEAGQRGRRVILIDHAHKLAEKIRISGGGRCNFTNRHCTSDNFISNNTHFCRSALARYTPQDFIARIEKHGIHYHEKKLGQLFCDDSALQIIAMLQKECAVAGVEWQMPSRVKEVKYRVADESQSVTQRFLLTTERNVIEAASLVIATGGLSIPQIGASGYGYQIANQFGIAVVPPKPGLVGLAFNTEDFTEFKDISGLSIEAEVSCNGAVFREQVLFTHRGLSGPAILQISSYWKPNQAVDINVLPCQNAMKIFTEFRHSSLLLYNVLSRYLPKRFVQVLCKHICNALSLEIQSMQQYSDAELQRIANRLHSWQIFPSGTVGYKKAEVTIGGVDTHELSSKTMQSHRVPGLYFIGEVVDVTGHLGGFNFQWAWSSGYAAGQFV